MKNKLSLIFAWEVKEKIRRKSFWFSTLFIPLFIFVISSVPFLKNNTTPQRPLVIGFIDSHNYITPYLVREIQALRAKDDNSFILMNLKTSHLSPETLFKNKDIDAILFIGSEGKSVKITTRTRRLQAQAEKFINILKHAFLSKKISELQLSPNIKKQLLSEPKISLSTQENGGDIFLTRFSGTFAFLLFFISSILFAGGMFTRSMADEKANRIIEILLTSTDAKTILLGKTLGLIAVNFLQLFLWVLLGILFFKSQILSAFLFTGFSQFLALFLAGYLMFTLLFVILGAFVKSDQDAQQFLAVISVIVILPVIIMLHIFNAPYDLLSTFMLYFPLTSIQTAMLKLIAHSLLPSELWISLSITFISFFLLLAFASKHFKKGILEYNTPNGN
jgi:ABC-2 type transport system permease protein